MFTNGSRNMIKDSISSVFENGRYTKRTLSGLLKASGLQEAFNDAVREVLDDMGASKTTRRRDRSTLYTID